MKKLIPYLLGTAILAMLAGCNKNKTTITVEEYGTGIPIPDARVSLVDCKREPSGGSDCFEIGYGTTDENGKFKTDKDAFAARASAEGYWPMGDELVFLGGGSVTSSVPNLIPLYPHAWLEVTIKNESGAYSIQVPGENLGDSPRNVLLQKGQQEHLTLFRKGNLSFTYYFLVQDTPGHFISDYSAIKITTDTGQQIELYKPIYHDFNIFLKGHETTKINITY